MNKGLITKYTDTVLVATKVLHLKSRGPANVPLFK
jgi:hypothetical protein